MVQLFCGTTVMYILRWVHMYFSLGLCYVQYVLYLGTLLSIFDRA